MDVVSCRILILCLCMCVSFFGAEQSGTEENPSLAEIAYNEQMWVKRARNSAVIVTLAWISWVVIVQVLATDIFPVSWFVRTPDQGEYTGW